MQTNEIDGSHGLLGIANYFILNMPFIIWYTGQFMLNGAEVDSTKRMVIRPGLRFEPVPVEPSETWDSPDNCWLRM